MAPPRTPLAPALTPVPPTSMPRDASPEQQHSAHPAHLRCSFDEGMSRLYPDYPPTPQEHIRSALYVMGATDDTLLEYLEIANKRWDEIFVKNRNGFPTFGEKPHPADDRDLHYFQIPDSILAIRIWPGGMQRFGGYCLDFFDVVERIPVNTPDGYVISYYPHVTPKSTLVTWERAAGVYRVRPGMEKYSIEEGALLMLTRPGKEPYCFQIPRRPTQAVPGFAQPQSNLALN